MRIRAVRVAMAVSAMALVMSLAPAPVGSQVPVPVPLLRLTPVATLQMPVATATRPGDNALYVAEQTGRVMAIHDGVVDPAPALDLTGQISSGGERGLLGLVFSRDGSLMYVNFTDPAGDTRVSEFRMSGGRADHASRRDLLFIDQPFANHNGGALAFGPGGHLYIATGDGGSGGDPQNNGQSLNTLLGKILRIDPRPSGTAAYTIPAGNPFVGVAGARPEIWSYGLRNPWRFSFDRVTGDIWIGDVGQNLWEEIDYRPASSLGGENYGWRQMEGTHPYNGGTEPPNHVPPIHEYANDRGTCAVTGGYVYRGTRIPSLQGTYVYSDYCLGTLRGLRQVAGTKVSDADLGAAAPLVASFGEDGSGELYVLSLGGPVFRIDPVLV
ncbi:MAG TPA: PQQ-dependent sugar dehydrogenase [Actinomycetota bacterium]|nr:PQQ-dependent sugar dehydrogenase [Actinomycetota bacterium]